MKLKPAQWALIAILISFTILMGFDLWFYIHGGIEATVSYAIWDLTKGWPILGVVVGIFIGHLFFPKDTNNVTQEQFDQAWQETYGMLADSFVNPKFKTMLAERLGLK